MIEAALSWIRRLFGFEMVHRHHMHDCNHPQCSGDYTGSSEWMAFICHKRDCKSTRPRQWDGKNGCWFQPDDPFWRD